MRALDESKKYLIADTTTYPADFHCPNPKGWYHSVGGVVETDEGLVAVYRLSDVHCAVNTHIMVAYSKDGGKTWSGHHSIAHCNVWEDHQVWVAPQLSKLKDGRLVIICDRGHRAPQDDWPMLTVWQKPPRGMANFLFWSDDNGKTWSEPVKIDDIGGEPSYIVELSNGALVYTRTESAVSESLEDPPLPWGNVYYQNTAVFSDDGGKTWDRTSLISDAPYHGDCEVGFVELEPGHLMAVTRIGFGGGQFAQPSRIIHSYDYGKTWGPPELAPFYGQRTIVGKLHSGKLLVTYRNRQGTPCSKAFVWDPKETLTYQPTSTIWDMERCRLHDTAMVLSTRGQRKGYVLFWTYPALDRRARVELDVEVKIDRAEAFGAVMYAGCPLVFAKDRLILGKDFPELGAFKFSGVLGEYGRFMGQEGQICIPVDTTQWHRYTIVRTSQGIGIAVDGDLKAQVPLHGYAVRSVGFGSVFDSVTSWRSVKANIQNPDDYSVAWNWNASSGTYPDQFQRDRTVILDYTVDSGYSGWTQKQDGGIVLVDYTNDSLDHGMSPTGPQPVLKAYVVTEEDLT